MSFWKKVLIYGERKNRKEKKHEFLEKGTDLW
jgi:hypothetical protein